MNVVNMLVFLVVMLAAGCATTASIPENCEIRHKGVCYESEGAACKAARCPPERCLILRSYPGQVECSQPTRK